MRRLIVYPKDKRWYRQKLVHRKGSSLWVLVVYQNALPAWVGIPAKLVTPEMNAHDVHDASEIVGENMQRISVATFGRRFNQEVRCPHPHLQRGEGMLDRLATRSAARKASMRFGRPSAETELKYPMSVPYHAHVEIRTLSMLSVSI